MQADAVKKFYKALAIERLLLPAALLLNSFKLTGFLISLSLCLHCQREGFSNIYDYKCIIPTLCASCFSNAKAFASLQNSNTATYNYICVCFSYV